MSVVAWCSSLLLALVLTAGSPVASDDLARLRQRALELTNAERSARGLPALKPGTALDQAAQVHAEDMLRRSYFDHRSLEGREARDRYLAAGGNPSELVAENIGRCRGCATPPDASTVEQLHRLWMESPGHRANILAQGIEQFGFGIAADAAQGVYAVQTFAGPQPELKRKHEAFNRAVASLVGCGAVRHVEGFAVDDLLVRSFRPSVLAPAGRRVGLDRDAGGDHPAFGVGGGPRPGAPGRWDRWRG